MLIANLITENEVARQILEKRAKQGDV